MKKILFLVLIVIAGGVFVSCHDDDENDNSRSHQNSGTVQQDTQTLYQREGIQGEEAD